jgi:hypothetical protein
MLWNRINALIPSCLVILELTLCFVSYLDALSCNCNFMCSFLNHLTDIFCYLVNIKGFKWWFKGQIWIWVTWGQTLRHTAFLFSPRRGYVGVEGIPLHTLQRFYLSYIHISPSIPYKDFIYYFIYIISYKDCGRI